MKNRNIIFLALIVVSAIMVLQGCAKSDNSVITTYKAAVIVNPTPAVDGVVALSGTSYTVKWEGTSSSWDVYLGTSENPGLAKAGVTGNSYTFTTAVGGEFWWYVSTKDANGIVSISPTWNFFINSAPTVPILSAPAANAVNFSVTGALTWTATDPEGDALTYDLYLGTTATPGAFDSNIADVTYSPALAANTKYYWKIVAKDSNGYSTSSAVSSFTTGAEAIMTYTGNYNVDEPAEGWSYPVALSKASSTSVKIDQYWASWPAIFTINVSALTYSMALTDFGGGYSAIESGYIVAKTGQLVGSYTIFSNGKAIEQGFHTYTKKP
jgi:hypothetical protein